MEKIQFLIVIVNGDFVYKKLDACEETEKEIIFSYPGLADYNREDTNTISLNETDFSKTEKYLL